ncbi:hypothetical protein [Companilactobacillus ginsenosidimutans]|uniref:Uncharacterized protein n=1 Tax=Companilactobacillus ginsenosidimutans TaxID=1007676 RepID=A0A0H4QK91_9LACO|nr:hypothetical protein [Companilactobacillus ginsenosidimutans]AKP67466.1 hypothetical protein ABM34_07940 [Companilactobacillus ginsenosidimutans]
MVRKLNVAAAYKRHEIWIQVVNARMEALNTSISQVKLIFEQPYKYEIRKDEPQAIIEAIELQTSLFWDAFYNQQSPVGIEFITEFEFSFPPDEHNAKSISAHNILERRITFLLNRIRLLGNVSRKSGTYYYQAEEGRSLAKLVKELLQSLYVFIDPEYFSKKYKEEFEEAMSSSTRDLTIRAKNYNENNL